MMGDGVKASLQVKNDSVERRWATTIRADAQERLSFRLYVWNTSAVKVGSSELRLIASTNGAWGVRPFTVSAAMRSSPSIGFATVAPVKIVALSNGLNRFHVSHAQVGEPSAAALRPLPAAVESGRGASQAELYEQELIGGYLLPAIPPHKAIILIFKGSYWLGEPGMELERGPKDGNLRIRISAWGKRVSARSGDILEAHGTINNTGFKGYPVYVRVRFVSADRGRVQHVTLLGKPFGEGGQRDLEELGRGVINADEGGGPIAVHVVPGSTELWASRTACSTESRRALPDGGLELGAIGGFRPRDPCSARSGFALSFSKLSVTPLRAHNGPS